MKVLHILARGDIGGIERLMHEYSMQSKLDNTFVFVWGGGVFYEGMKNNNVDCLNLNEPNKRLLKTVKDIIDICDKIKPNIVVFHNLSPTIILVLLYLNIFEPKIKRLIYVHSSANYIGNYSNIVKQIISRFLVSIGMKYTNKIIAISNFVKESVIECFHVSKEKINVIYNGVNTDRFIRIKLPENRNTIVEIIYIGRLYKEKGVQNILKALSRLDINYYFRIVGDGLYRDKLEDITEQYNLKDKVEFCGKRTNVPELLWQSDIFIHMPDLEEGFGISVIEAMAAGKVCIVANSGAMSEIITDGVNGFMVEKGNIQELSEKINEVAVQINTDVIKKIRENAVNRAKDFSIEIFTKQLDDVLKINS